MQVNLIAYMRLNPDMFSPLDLGIMMDNESELIASSAMRGCNTTANFTAIVLNSHPDEIRNRMRSAVKLQHSTVAGMTDWIFEIRNFSRAMAQQLTRHRTAWYLSQSQRTINQYDLSGVVPDTIRENPDAAQITFDVWVTAQNGYKKLVDMGIPLEDARYYLTSSKHTSLIMKIDGCNLIHFLNLRMLGKHAQWEIKELAQLIYELVKMKAPNLFAEDLQEYWW